MTRHSFWVVVLIVGGISASAVADPAAEKSSADSGYPAQTALGQGVYDLTTVYARLGAAEDAELTSRYQRAAGLLWTAPCDLAAASAAVADYQQAILALGGRRQPR